MELFDEDWQNLWNIVSKEQQTRGRIKRISLTIREHKHPEDTILYGNTLALGGGYNHLEIEFKNGEKCVYDGTIPNESL